LSKITLFELAVDLNSSLMFVAVHTGAGTTGLGEAILKSRTDIVESVLRWLDCGQVHAAPGRDRTAVVQPHRSRIESLPPLSSGAEGGVSGNG
jgi:hypothetical protein